MSRQNGGIHRLEQVFRLLEHARAMDLQTATAAVIEVERTVEKLTVEQDEIGRARNIALLLADQGGQAVTHVVQRRLEVVLTTLETLRVHKELLRADSRERYRTSRLQMQQMETAALWVKSRAEAKRLVSTRNEDVDRFMTRRLWVEGEDRR